MVSSFKLAKFFGFEELGNPVGLWAVSVHFGKKAIFTRFCIKCTSKLSESSQNLQRSPYVSDFFPYAAIFKWVCLTQPRGHLQPAMPPKGKAKARVAKKAAEVRGFFDWWLCNLFWVQKTVPFLVSLATCVVAVAKHFDDLAVSLRFKHVNYSGFTDQIPSKSFQILEIRFRRTLHFSGERLHRFSDVCSVLSQKLCSHHQRSE